MKCKCLNPRQAWKMGKKVSKDGVLSDHLTFSEREAWEYWKDSLDADTTRYRVNRAAVSIPCGKCEACALRKRKDMSVRLSHECEMHDAACFITLTYDDDNLPYTDSLVADTAKKSIARGYQLPFFAGGAAGYFPTLLPSDVQKFVKRLRRHLEYVPKRKSDKRDHCKDIRYFVCGEYGTKTHRPHYHLIIFGWKPSDLELFFKSKKGSLVYRSKQVEKLWKFGISSVGDVNCGVAKYCARYVTKKFARLSEKKRLDDDFIIPEFTLQSTRFGGIGSPWLAKYGDCLKTGMVNVRNGDRVSRCSIPKYYLDRLRKINLPLWFEVRNERIKFYENSKPSFDDTALDALRRYVECRRLQDEQLDSQDVF